MENKFKIGQDVKISNDGEVGKILGFSFNGEKFIYTVSSREVDIAAKKIIKGIKTCGEDELEEVVVNE